MDVDWTKVADVLVVIAEGATTVSPVLPEPAASILRFAAACAHLGADIARTGNSPIDHIERVHAAEPMLVDVDNAWINALREKSWATPTSVI